MQSNFPLSQTQSSPSAPLANLANLPPARFLSRISVRIYAKAIASHFTDNPPNTITKCKSKFQFKTKFYGITVSSQVFTAVILRAQCKKFWRNELEKKCNQDRLNYEANNRLVGAGNDPNFSGAQQLYCSDATLQRIKEKQAANESSLANQYIINTQTGETANLLEVIRNKEESKVAEIYNLCKSLERLSDSQSFKWAFITLTAPARYHPNPSKGKNRYDRNIGIKASHDYINNNWKRIRAILSSRGIPASPETYFGFRTVEPHKDGSIHWHVILFSSKNMLGEIEKAIREKFPTRAAAEIMIGEYGPGSAKASSYIFKYIIKAFSKKDLPQSNQDDTADSYRESKDLASMRNRERVQAAIKSLNIRQFQLFGVRNLITTFRKINSLKLHCAAPTKGSVLDYIKTEIWRNPNGYFNMLSKSELFDGKAEVQLIMEDATNSYGEPIKKCIGIKLGGNAFLDKSDYKVESYQNINLKGKAG